VIPVPGKRTRAGCVMRTPATPAAAAVPIAMGPG
jgi:hypothetical protein